MKIVRCVSALLLSSFVAGCTVWPVGQDPYSLQTRRDANRVVEAIQTYRLKQGAYPPNLNALVPSFIAQLPDGPTLQYNPYDGSISYHYIPSWPQLHWTYCASVGDTTNWRCEEKMI